MRCGHCKIYDVDVEHVRRCSKATYAPAGFGQAKEFAPVAARPAVTEAGMYRQNGTTFKVQKAVHGSGHLYAKRLVLNTEGTAATFEYAPGALLGLSADDRLTLAEAREYGALYGTCIVCGRTLTDEKSIEAGIGPVCAGRL